MTTLLRSAAASLVALALGTSLTAATVATEDKHPLFDRIDSNHDGLISLREWMTARHEFLSQRRAEGAGGGARSTMTSLNHGSQAGTTGAGATTPVTTGQHPRRAGEDENQHPFFDRIDSNHDGQISLPEWMAFRHEHHGEHHRPGSTATTSGRMPPTTTPP